MTLHFTLAPGSHSDTTATSCTPIQWHGTTYTTSGDYDYISVSPAGCPDTVTLHFTLAPGAHSDTTATSCTPIQWHGQTYSTSGDYD
ncbi:MAG: hypothetical protein EON98_15630, partial [Chitinophagaceae bacterium]